MTNRKAGDVGPQMLRTAKDSVFTSLFSDPKYAYELYRCLHPEDDGVQPDDIEVVTVQNVMTADQHNDLGLAIGDKLLVLVEAQSTWSPNIVLRALLYTAETLKRYINEHELDVYGGTPVRVPRPELYVVYTGRGHEDAGELTLSGTLFGGERSDIESTVHVLSADARGVVGQYVTLARELDSARDRLGPTREAVEAAIDKCISEGVLVGFLESRRKEVVTMMMALYDEREVQRNYVASQRREAAAEGRAEGRAEGEARGILETCRTLGADVATAARMLVDRLGLPADQARERAEAFLGR